MQPPEHQPSRILVVDDHCDSAQALARLLRREGHEVTTAHTVAAALAMATGGDLPDTLICDMQLPDGDGCELLRQLIAIAGDRGLPAIAVTGLADKWVDKCRRAGYRRVLTKPLRFEDVRGAIAALRTHEHRALGGVPTPVLDTAGAPELHSQTGAISGQAAGHGSVDGGPTA
jgi:CheY-like chemotaxis protein